MKKRRLASLMKHQNKKLPVTMKMWMQFNVMPWRSLGVAAVYRHARTMLHKTHGVCNIVLAPYNKYGACE